MRSIWGWFLVAVALGCAVALPAAAKDESRANHGEVRLALVIGNGTYKNVPPLKDAHDDQTAVADSLEHLGFKVTRVSDATFDDFRRALLEFGRLARGADIAVVYYVGHGMVSNGENWLLPTDAELKSDVDVDNEAIGLQAVMRTVSAARDLGIVILDACRENPFLAGMKRTNRGRGAEQQGLAAVEPNDNILVAFAAKDGTTALEPTGPQSPLATALLKNLETPGLEIAFLFRNVHDDVLDLTHNQQEPAVYGSLSKDEIYLKPLAKKARIAAELVPGPTAEEIAWTFLRESADVGTIKKFVDEFSTGKYVAAAKMRIASLEMPVSAPEPAGVAADEIGWSFLKDGKDVASFRRFVAQFPDSEFAADAQLRIAALDQPSQIPLSFAAEQSPIPPPSQETGPDASPAALPKRIEQSPPPRATDDAADQEERKAKEAARRVQRNTKAVEKAWLLVQNTSDAYVLRKFADTFPTRRYRAVATQRLASLGSDGDRPRVNAVGKKLTTTERSDNEYYALQCDRLASDPRDGSRPAGISGVSDGGIDAARGAAACRRAVSFYPNVPRLQFQLCRCMVKTSPKEAADMCSSAAAAAQVSGNGSAVLYSATAVAIRPLIEAGPGAAPVVNPVVVNAAVGGANPLVAPPVATSVPLAGPAANADVTKTNVFSSAVRAATPFGSANPTTTAPTTGVVPASSVPANPPAATPAPTASPAPSQGQPAVHEMSAGHGNKILSSTSVDSKAIGSKVIDSKVIDSKAKATAPRTSIKVSTAKDVKVIEPRTHIRVSTPHDVKASTPSPHVHVSTRSDVKITAPKVNIQATPKVTIAVPKTPTVHVSTPTVHASTPKVNIAVPKVNVHVATPSVKVAAPKINVRVPTIKVPTIH